MTINGSQYRKDDSKCELRSVENPKQIKKFASASEYRQYIFWTEGLQPLIGQRVVAAEMEQVEYHSFRELSPVIRFDGGDALYMVRDEEANGSGRYFYF